MSETKKFTEVTYETFKDLFTEQLLEHTPRELMDCKIELRKLKKNNVTLDGITITKSDSNVAPTFYINHIYESFKRNNYSLEEIVKNFVDDYEKTKINYAIDISNDFAFEKAKHLIFPAMISFEGNESYLENYPYTIMSDLAITYKIKVDKPNIQGSITITHTILKMWDKQLEEIHQIAIENISELLKPRIVDIRELLIKKMGFLEEDEIPNLISDDAEIEMNVITNAGAMYGSSSILDNEFMAHVCEQIGTDFFIIPSSIHELILVKDFKDPDQLSMLRMMVKEVNDFEVMPEERLSYNVYRYNTKVHTLEIA